MVEADVYWMGGSPCSGKSSIGEILAKRHELQLYRCDELFAVHQKKVTPERHPVFYRLGRMTWDEIWMRPLGALVADEADCYREEFGMIVEDLRRLAEKGPVLAEGTALLPEKVVECVEWAEWAIWVVPTEAFQLEHYRRRGGWVEEILTQCSRPEEAFANWMRRDVAFARWIEEECARLQRRCLVVDGSRSIEENAEIVERHFSLSR